MKFYHYIGVNNKGGCTVAYDLVEHEQGKTLTIALGFCSHKDTYCKKKGRDAALKQWVNGNKLNVVYKGKKKELEHRMLSIASTFTRVFDLRITDF